MDRIIVSRHPATVEFIARALSLTDERNTSPREEDPHYGDGTGEFVVAPDHFREPHGGVSPRFHYTPVNECLLWREYHSDTSTAGPGIPVIVSATPDDVRGKVVYGNLPMHLACLAREVSVVEFAGTPPRGQEYTLAEMDAAGARLVRYIVLDQARSEQAQHGLRGEEAMP